MTSVDKGLIAAAIVQAVATIVLVAVTIAYVVFTKRQADETRKGRLSAQPFVIPDTSIGYYAKGYYEELKGLDKGVIPISITNVGTETAIELKLELKTPKDEQYKLIGELPLLTQNTPFKDGFIPYWIDEEANPNSPNPVPAGLYEIKVSFRSTTSKPGSAPSEVILPFTLKKDQNIWKVERGALIQKLTEA